MLDVSSFIESWRNASYFLWENHGMLENRLLLSLLASFGDFVCIETLLV